MNICKHSFELANGETLVCHLEKEHDGDCNGSFMGTVASFPKEFDSEYEIYMNNERDKQDEI